LGAIHERRTGRRGGHLGAWGERMGTIGKPTVSTAQVREGENLSKEKTS